MESHDRARVAFVHIVLIQPCLSPSAIITVGLVYVSLFCSNPKGSGLVVWEIKRRDGHLSGFIMTGMNKLERFLKCQNMAPIISEDDLKAHLWLSEHVHQPTAHHAICATCDQVMRILCAHHLHGINWMCMSSGREWSFQYWKMFRAGVPE